MLRWIRIAAAGLLMGCNGLSLSLILCFRDQEIVLPATVALVVGSLLGIPLVVMPVVRWLRRPAELSLQGAGGRQWLAGLALLSAKVGKKRSAKSAHLLCESGVMDVSACRFNQGEWKLREAAELFAELEDRPNEALALMELGNCKHAAGDHDGAIREYCAALELWEHIADAQRAGNTWRLLNNLSAAYSEKGDLETAERYCRRALHTARDVEARAMCEMNLADLHRKRRQFDDAQEVLAGSLEQLGRSRDESFAFGVMTLAMIHDDQQDVRAAEELYKQARELMEQRLGARHIEVARLLERYGALLERHGRSREGAALLAQAAGIRDTVG
ncbi:MAG: tetratricopeptide repeat protein [Acidobacteria bacterium]|nr:tetratricopeptide repeat protein [Acidobacteriota bacterium]